MKIKPARTAWRVGIACSLLGITCLNVHAQAPGFTIKYATKPDIYGTLAVTAHNNSAMDITALFIFHVCKTPEDFGISSSAVGSDYLMQFSLRKIPASAMKPGSERTFDTIAQLASCSSGASAVFADGHGEGTADGEYGWKQVLINRHAAHLELLRTRALLKTMPAQPDQFATDLTQTLEARRISLTNPHTRDVPSEEVKGRTEVDQRMLTYLRQSNTVPKQFSNSTETLTTLDRWMAPLKNY